MTAGLRYGVEIRAALPGDAAELARLLACAGLDVPVHEMAARADAIRAHAAATVLVATGYAGLSGLVTLCWAPSLYRARPTAEIGLLMVDPEERRHGIGRLLLKAASQAARVAGCDAVRLAVAAEHPDLAAFCQATGFATLGEVLVRELRKRG